MAATIRDSKSTSRSPDRDSPAGQHVVLILSSDAVAAALLGALVETLGYLVRFYHPPDHPDDALRRERPTVALVDCEDPTVMNDELLGRARMRGVSVIIFATAHALSRMQRLASEHEIETLLMPTTLDRLDEMLGRIARRPG